MAHSVVTLGLHRGSTRIPVLSPRPLPLGGRNAPRSLVGRDAPWFLLVADSNIMSCHVYDPAACSLYCYRL